MSIMNKVFPTKKKYEVTTSYKGNIIGECFVESFDKAESFIPDGVTDAQRKKFDIHGSLAIQVGRNMVQIKEVEMAVPPKKLYEARLKHNDPEMQEYHQERHNDRQAREAEKERVAGAPYYVGYSGQTLEWYGADDPSTGKGRYKSKGEGGRIVFINVPSYQQAEQLEKKIDEKHRQGTLDPHLEGKMGEDHTIIHYHGPYIRSMSDMDEYDKVHLRYDHPIDMSKHGQ